MTLRQRAIARLLAEGFSERICGTVVDVVLEEVTSALPEEVRARWIINGRLRIDTHLESVLLDGKDAGLSPKEYRLMEYLCRNAGRVLSVKQILKNVWGEAQASDPITYAQYVRVFVGNIRRTMGDDIIKTKSGVGYYIPLAGTEQEQENGQ